MTALTSLNLTIVIPVYNEADVIEKVIRDYHRQVISQIPSCRLVVAEDGSTDGSDKILLDLKQELDFILVSSRDRKGYTQAVKDALCIPDTEWILFSDSDGQHDVNDVFTLIEQRAGHDIIGGWKKKRQDPFHRLCMSFLYNALIRSLFGVQVRDINAGFKLLRRDVVQSVLPRVNVLHHCVMSEIILKAIFLGFSYSETVVAHHPRASGGSSIFHADKLPGIIIDVLRGLLVIRRDRHQILPDSSQVN